MKHIIESKINKKEIDHAVARGEAKIKIDELMDLLKKQSQEIHFDQEQLAFHFFDLFNKMFVANTISMQLDTLKGLTIYED